LTRFLVATASSGIERGVRRLFCEVVNHRQLTGAAEFAHRWGEQRGGSAAWHLDSEDPS